MADSALAFFQKPWDAIVVGTGIGGATLGHGLAKAGMSVLFLERGRQLRGDTGTLAGRYAEMDFPHPDTPSSQHAELLAKAGRCQELVIDISQEKHRSFIPFLGSGTGGSSALFGMAMERFARADFFPRRNHPEAEGTTLPDAWPITYDELAPYYAAAECLYRVRGTGDAGDGTIAADIQALPTLTEPGRELWRELEQAGLHPYRLPMACDFVPGCQGCQGHLCPRDCKQDGARVCLEEAMAKFGASLITECHVDRLLASRGQVTGVECRRNGESATLRAGVVVLAAGALATPCVLLRSANHDWPKGLANRSGLVGRNLMRHYVDLYVLKSPVTGAIENRQKELAFNDFYQTDHGKWGGVQSFGRLPPAEMLLASLLQDIRDGPLPWLAEVVYLFGPIMRLAMSRLVERSVVLASIVEDLPYSENAVGLSPSGSITITYRISQYDRRRIEALRNMLRARLKPNLIMSVKQAENNQRIAHVCGTCRFGADPYTSVLDPTNRAHELSNLYVVDGSFLPSSGGTNPALTIAANALRVAECIRRLSC